MLHLLKLIVTSPRVCNLCHFICFTTRWCHCSTLQQPQLPEASSLGHWNMTGQSIAGINQEGPAPSLLAVDGLASGPPGETGFFTDDTVSILTSTHQLAQTLLSRTLALKNGENPAASAEGKAGSSCDEDGSNNAARRKREFIDEEKKDESYWDKRRKNNEAAKRSREKRRANDKVLEQRVLGLLEENTRLRAELLALKFRFGLVKDTSELSVLAPSSHLCCHRTPNATHYYHADPHTPHYNPVYGAQTVRTLSGQGMSEDHNLPAICSPSASGPLCKRNRPSPRHPALEQQQQQELEHNPNTWSPESHEGHYANRQEPSEGLKSLPHKLRFKSPVSCSDGGDTSPTSYASVLAALGPNVQLRCHQQAGWDTQTDVQPPWSHEEAGSGLGLQHQSPHTVRSNPPAAQNPRDGSCLAEDVNLRSEISTLSQEVAQLKKLLSQQLLCKTP